MHYHSDLWIQRVACVDRCLGKLNADTLAHFHIYLLFTVRSLPISSADYFHFFMTGELQDFAFFSPVHDGVQLLLDALWRDLSSHTHRGGCVRWETTHAVVLSPGLGYVISFSWVLSHLHFCLYIYNLLLVLVSENHQRPKSLRNDVTLVKTVQSPRLRGRSPLTSSYTLSWTWGSVRRWRGMIMSVLR